MTFNLGAVAFSSTHLKSTIKVQDHPAELNICLGHSDSYTGVKQSTLTSQPLNTSGQGKYNQTLWQREFAFLLFTNFLDKTDCTQAPFKKLPEIL